MILKKIFLDICWIHYKFLKLKEKEKNPVVVQQAAPAADDPLAQLEKLNKLKEAGILSEEEFSAKKAALLAKL